MIRRMPTERRKGSIVPLVAVSMVALVGCVALAIDIGLFAEARTCMQDAVDAAVLVGVRQMDTVSANPNTNAINMANTIVTTNTIVGKAIAGADVKTVQAGVYRYDPVGKKFNAIMSAPNAGENWSALTMTIQYDQPTVFARVFGVTKQTIVTSATAVHRPRDIAIVLDFSGSMCFGSMHNNAYYNGNVQSQNVDPNFPRFGPYSIFGVDDPTAAPPGSPSSPMQNTGIQSGGGYTYAPSNMTWPTVGHGPPILHDFASYNGLSYNAAAWANDIPGYASQMDVPIAPQATAPSAAGSYFPGLYTPLISTYNPLKTTNTSVMPAPIELYNQNDPGWKYTQNGNGIWESVLGDKFPYRVNVTALPSVPSVPTPANYATNVHQFLQYMVTNNAITNVQAGLPVGSAPPAGAISDTSAASGTAGWWWEYGNQSGANPPSTALDQQKNNGGYSFNSPMQGNNPQISTAGYTMGPNAYGKTFYMWPPDPRTPSNNASIAAPAAGESPATAWARGYRPGDWRQRFFNNADNSVLWSTSNKFWRGNASTSGGAAGPAINYNNVLAWIKGGPQIFPNDLRCGRVLYYDAIPTSIPSGNAMNDLFWQHYIDYVLGYGNYDQDGYLYGYNSSTSWNGGASYGSTQISVRPAAAGMAPNQTQVSMNYSDMPYHPRAHFWFGPTTMLAFMEHYVGGWSSSGGGIMPGTCKEAQSWELKTAVQSALDDIKKNHPNDFTTVAFFSGYVNAYNGPKYPLGNDYDAAKLLMWFPDPIGGQHPIQYIGTPTTTIRPYDASFNSITGNNTGILPTAHGNTAYAMGLQVAYNQFSTNSSAASGGQGRTGANKLVIFETDGVPNTLSNGTYSAAGPGNSYYNSISTAGSGDATGATAISCIQNMTNATNGWGNRCQVHCIGFGDLLEPSAPSGPRNTAISILGNMQAAGNTSNPIESYKLVTGTFSTRITNLQTAFQRILQGSIQISLIQ